jgi:hypothetical protein
MQTNNIIILGNEQFLTLKENKLVKVNLIAKLKEKFNLITLLLFNGYILSLNKAKKSILLILILQNKDMWSNMLIEFILLLSVNLRLLLIYLSLPNTRNQLKIMFLP